MFNTAVAYEISPITVAFPCPAPLFEAVVTTPDKLEEMMQVEQ